MQYSLNEAMNEVMARRKALLRKREANRARRYAGASAVLTLLLVLSLSRFAAGTAGAVHNGYGSFLLSANAGGYVLAGVVCFALGVIFALLCKRSTTHKEKEEETKEEEQ